VGSHIDTVPDAGAFDGVLGVVLGLQLVAEAQANTLPLAIEVIAFSEEEGVRFGVPFLGSRAVAGRFDPALLELRDTEGISVEEAIRRFGLDPAELDDAQVWEDALGYLEIHIEQGPVLEAENLPLGVVTGIVGQSRYEVTFTGKANHAGTTPMRLRGDALAGAAEWVLAVETLALSHAEGAGLVATVGRLQVEPNAGNVVPGRVRVSLDVRSELNSVRQSAVDELLRLAQAIASRRGLGYDGVEKMSQPAAAMDEQWTAMLAESVCAAGFTERRMPSGAGHDAMVMATRLPSAMLFLRSPGGISHHPAESVLQPDVEAALLACDLFLRRIAAKATI
jgi:allantoate deiminase